MHGYTTIHIKSHLCVLIPVPLSIFHMNIAFIIAKSHRLKYPSLIHFTAPPLWGQFDAFPSVIAGSLKVKTFKWLIFIAWRYKKRVMWRYDSVRLKYFECSEKKDYFILAWSYKFATGVKGWISGVKCYFMILQLDNWRKPMGYLYNGAGTLIWICLN